jgi:hypothetical protein
MLARTETQLDERHVELEFIRLEILQQIAGPDGRPVWSKANKMARAQIPTMCAATVINFATGETKRPSTWTIKCMTRQADMRLVAIPASWKLRKGMFEL